MIWLQNTLGLKLRIKTTENVQLQKKFYLNLRFGNKFTEGSNQFKASLVTSGTYLSKSTTTITKHEYNSNVHKYKTTLNRYMILFLYTQELYFLKKYFFSQLTYFFPNP